MKKIDGEVAHISDRTDNLNNHVKKMNEKIKKFQEKVNDFNKNQKTALDYIEDKQTDLNNLRSECM